MTFGAVPLWPASLLLAATVALTAWLFLLKVRAPRTPVASLLLWRRVLDESREQTLWERIRRAVSLVVTVVIAIVLLLAAIRPSRTVAGARGAPTGRLLVVVDSSWSMLTKTRSGETRWERAVAQARRVIASRPGAEIALATTADGLAEGPTSDRALLEAALDRIAPAGDSAAWPRLAGAEAVHFITDGTIPRQTDRGVILHSVFEPAANVAITAFDVRPSIAGVRAGDAYLEVANYAPAAQQVRIVVSRGNATIVDRQVNMAPGEALRQAFPIAYGADAALRARVDARENALAIDDVAFGWAARARPLAIAIVGNESSWLRPLFEQDPNVRVTLVATEGYPREAERADVVIFDRWAPRDAPSRPALSFAPVEGRGSAEELRPRWEAAGVHPVVRGVDPFTLTIERARTYSTPGLVPVAASTRGTPLVYVSQSPVRQVVITFGPNESNLTAAPAFPVLVGNAIDWLTTPTPYVARHPGLASFDGGVSSVSDPDGTAVSLTKVNAAAVGILRSPGLYMAEGGGARTTFPVNAGDPQISNVMRTTIDAAAQANTVSAGAAQWPWWIYCALAAFGLALAEWWTWQRRITV